MNYEAVEAGINSLVKIDVPAKLGRLLLKKKK